MRSSKPTSLSLALAAALASCGGGSAGDDKPDPSTDFAGSWNLDLAVTSSSCPANIGVRQTMQAVITESAGTFHFRGANEAPGNELVGTVVENRLELSRGGDTASLDLLDIDTLEGLAVVIDGTGNCTDGIRVDGTRITDYWQVPPGNWTFELSENSAPLETFAPAPLAQAFAAVSGAAGRMRGSLLRNVWTGVVRITTGEEFVFSGSFAGSRDSFVGTWVGDGGRGGPLLGSLQIGGTCLTLDVGTWTFTLSDLNGTALATFDGATLAQTACNVTLAWSDASGSLDLSGTLSGISGAEWTPTVSVTGSTWQFDVTDGQFTLPTLFSGLFDATAYGGTTGTIVGTKL